MGKMLGPWIWSLGPQKKLVSGDTAFKKEMHYIKNENSLDYNSVVEHLLSLHEALDPILSTEKIRN